MPDSTRIQVLAPLIKDRKGRHEKVFEDVRKAGFVRVRVNGEVRDVSDDIELARYESHTIEVVVDRLVVRHFEDPESEEARSARSRLTDSIETALEMGEGVVIINDVTDAKNPKDHLYSEKLACVFGHGSLPEIEPRTFSFNNPHGACPTCQGLGVRLETGPELVVPRPEAMAVTIADLPIHEVSRLTVLKLRDWVKRLRGSDGQPPALNERERQIAYQVLKEIDARVGFLADVGLDYLTMARAAGTLS